MNRRRVYAGLLGLIVLLGAGLRTHASDLQYAMQLPGASQSLLLDIDRAGDRLVAVGERGHILVSEDHGASWQQVAAPTTAMLTRVFFIDERHGWAVGHDGNVLVSRDGGLTWTLQRDGIAEQAGINEARAGRARTQVAALEAALAAAPEGERDELELALEDARWQLERALEVLDSPVYPPPLMDVWFASPERGWASGAYGTLLHTANGGRRWEDWSYKVDNPDELHFNGVTGDGLGTLYLASEWGSVFRSGNEGERWALEDTGYDGSFFGIVSAPGSDTVFAYGLRGTIYRRDADGWQELDSGVSASLFGATVHDGTVVFVGRSGAATLSADGGEHFSPLVQSRRDGLFGVVALDDGQLIAAGEGGSRALVRRGEAAAP